MAQHSPVPRTACPDTTPGATGGPLVSFAFMCEAFSLQFSRRLDPEQGVG